MTWQKATLFAGGLVLGIAAGVAGVMSFTGANPLHPAVAKSAPPASLPVAPMAVGGAAPRCEELSPVVAKGAEDDGRLALQRGAAGATANDVSALLLEGKEAAAGGHRRDAEIVFLNACRTAQGMKEADDRVQADAMYQLARHYANAAAFGAPGPRALYERANRFYSAALQVYQSRLGPDHEKTRYAREGLITVQQVTGVLPPLQAPAVAQQQPAAPAPVAESAPAPAPAAPPAVTAAAPAAPAPAAPVAVRAPVASTPVAPPPAASVAPTAAMGAAPASTEPPKSEPAKTEVAKAEVAKVEPARPDAPTPRTTSPSFSCAQARSTTEKLICGDEELARMDRELGRLHQRAKQAAADPRAFQRSSDAEWQRREDTCRDRECLRAWYAQRREELSAAASAPPRPAPMAVPTKRTEAAAEAPQAVVRSPAARGTQPADTAGPGTASGDIGTATGAATGDGNAQ